jgi:glutamate formiminotransferase/formiminotetrahydrofolate cyclodeaminase
VTMDECVHLARRLGERVGRELEIPVFLYARAATRPERERLPDIRKGEFEGLRETLGTDPAREPDFGPARIHPTAGATAVGARPFLVAYNVYLDGGDVALAKTIAKGLRTSDGGLPAVQAKGFDVEGVPQVSMNLLDIDATPLHVAFDAVDAAARAAGAAAGRSELVGLVPERAVHAAAAAHVRLQDAMADHVLERLVRRSAGPGLGEWMDSVASASPSPGGGTVAAVAGGIAAALAAMVARLTVGRKKYAEVDAEFRTLLDRAEALRVRLVRLGDDDAAAYDAVSAAYGVPKTEEVRRTAAIQAALVEATRVPLETLRAAREVAAIAARAAEAGNRNAGVAGLLAEAAAKGAAYNVRINVASMPDRGAGVPLAAEAATLLAEAEAAAARAAAAVEISIGT